MEDFIVSARKYRPTTFDSVVGQSALTTTLKNAVRTGKLAHAYLFCGPRGVGKTTCARIFAKAINCEHPTADGEACNECESCRAFNEGRSLNIFELDAASNNSVDNMRKLTEQTAIPPQLGKYKVFIIDEVHMLSTAAFNAFLKTLEEPPSYVIFILATTEKHKILPTIISRCQIYDFERMNVQDTVAHLKSVAEREGIQYEEKALAFIAEKADGGMRDALSIFDQVVSYSQGNLTYEKTIEDLNELDADNYFRLVDLAVENRVTDIMLLVNDIVAKGFDPGHLINGLATHLRNVLMAKDPQTLPLLEVSQEQAAKYQDQALKCPTPFLYQGIKLLNRCDLNYRQSSNKRLLVEITLIQLAQATQPDDDDSAGRSPRRLKSLFRKLKKSLTPEAQQVAKPAADKAAPAAPAASVANPAPAAPATPKEPKKPAQPAAPAALKRQKSGFGMTFGSLLKQDTHAVVEEEETPVDAGDVHFTADELQLEWLAMCNRMPAKMRAMAYRLKNAQVHITEFPQVEVVLDNKLLLDEVEKIERRIRATLAQALHNSALTLTCRLARPDEIQELPTREKVLKQMLAQYDWLQPLINELQLERAD